METNIRDMNEGEKGTDEEVSQSSPGLILKRTLGIRVLAVVGFNVIICTIWYCPSSLFQTFIQCF